MGVLRGKAASRQAAVEARIRAALVQLGPLLRMEPAALDLLGFSADTGTATLRIEGECPDCAMSITVLRQGIEAHLRLRVAEIRVVRIEDATTSEAHG